MPGTAEPRLIDVHHHLAPPPFVAEIVARRTGQHALIDWTPARSIAEMDRAGVATSILSIAPPGVWHGDAGAARDLARACNEFGARLASDHPGRFGLFAAIPLPAIDASLDEIAHALDTLGADGIALLTSTDGTWLGDPAFEPVMAELDRRRAIVYVHPDAPHCCRNLIPGVPDHVVEFSTDTSRAVVNLLAMGTLQRYPGIRLILAHGGGTIPYLTERLTRWVGAHAHLQRTMPDGPIAELRKLHYDTAFVTNPFSLSCLLQLVTPARVLFGSDFPFQPCHDQAAALRAAGLSPQELAAIERDNALALLSSRPGRV